MNLNLLTEPTTDDGGRHLISALTSNPVQRQVTPPAELGPGAPAAQAAETLAWALRLHGTDLASAIEHVQITDLGEAGYGIRRTIPVEIKKIEAGNFEASFREANIAISGVDSDDAYQALVAEILDTFDVLVQEPTLGPDAAEQLGILRTYIVRT